MLTRPEMEKVIREGGSVLHNGEVISSIDKLPSETDLAGNDAKRLQSVLDAHDEQIAKLQAERSRTSEQLKRAQDEQKKAPAPKPPEGQEPVPSWKANEPKPNPKK